MSEVTSGLEASWVEGLSEVSPLRGEWEKLSAESEPEFYFCYDFVELCLRHAAREGKLAVVVAIREEGRLVGVFPFELYRARRFGLRRNVLRFAGGCFSPVSGGLVQRGKEREAGLCCAQHLLGPARKKWDVFKSWGLRAEDLGVKSLLDGLRHGRVSLLSAEFAETSYLDLQRYSGFSHYYGELSSSTKRIIRRGERKLSSAGRLKLALYENDAQDIDAALADYKAVVENSWHPPEKNSLFFDDFVRMLAALKQLRLFILYVAENRTRNLTTAAGETWIPVAANLYVNWARQIYAVRTAYRSDFNKSSPGIVLLRYILETLMDRDRAEKLSFQVGREPYKLQFGAEPGSALCVCWCVNPASLIWKVLYWLKPPKL